MKYILSQDAYKLLSEWAKKNNFRLPDESCFCGITESIVYDLQQLFGRDEREAEIVLVEYNAMREGLSRKAKLEDGCVFVSVDRVYFPGDIHIEMNRVVRNEAGQWIDVGRFERPGFDSLDRQIETAARFSDGFPVILVDDGCWSEASLAYIGERLAGYGVRLKKAIVGINVVRGESRLPFPLDSLFDINESDLIDWICERDFLPGIPLGGKTVMDPQLNIGAYYLWEMGDFRSWASLDFSESVVRQFTRRRLHSSLDLFQQIESLSGKTVFIRDLGRIPFGWHNALDEKFTDVCQKKIGEL